MRLELGPLKLKSLGKMTALSKDSTRGHADGACVALRYEIMMSDAVRTDVVRPNVCRGDLQVPPDPAFASRRPVSSRLVSSRLVSSLLVGAAIAMASGPLAADESRPVAQTEPVAQADTVAEQTPGEQADDADGSVASGKPENEPLDQAGEDAAPEADPVERSFTLDVLPVLREKCFGCHGEDASDMKGDLDVRSREGLLKGGESGDPSIIPGDADDSLLVQAISWDGIEMPPKENDRLTADQIAKIRIWIDHGAPWPEAQQQQRYRDEARRQRETEEGHIVDTSGGTSDEWTYRRYQPEDLWAWRPRRSRKELLDAASTDQNPVDHFIDQRLRDAGFQRAAPAPPQVLIRRATFDLIGIPPTPEETDAFLASWAKDPESAWAELIDRLLESPHYGERWAQHWLDVTRYADTGGMSNDFERSNLWRYRDYVVRSLNHDKPYNEFVIEQIAGDELADASVRRRLGNDDKTVLQAQIDGDYAADEAEWIVATGFLRLGPWDNAMVDTEEARQIFLDDVVNVVGQAFLSTTMRCVKCHDHKFDPIPTRDYYRMYAAFAATQMAERKVPFLPAESLHGFGTGKQHVERMLAFATAEKNKLVAKREAAAKAWFDERGLPYKDLDERQDLPDDEKPPRHVGLDHVEQGQLKVREQDEWIWTRRLERYEPMAQSVYNAASVDLAWNGARKLRIDAKAERNRGPAVHVLVGGALTALGDAVGPGVLSAAALHAIQSDDQEVIDETPDDPFLLTDDIDGRRLGLARWIADPDNPLTARSIVNRVWKYHFGHGIARNPNNFGSKGAKPTHLDLLDYLADDFVAGGWRLKRLHRQLMMSDTYRQAGQNRDAKKLAEQDPNNELWAYFPQRRLTSEELRDSLLSVTGELNDRVGGLPVMPEINMEVALQPRMIQFSLAPAYQPSPTPSERNRRTIYAYRVRGQADPFLELFNKPNPNDSCEHRDTAAVTPQAFTLLNSDLITDRSIAMAVRLQNESNVVSDQVGRAFQLILGRPPNRAELEHMTKYVTDMIKYHNHVEATPVTYPTTITRSLVEEFSGKPFEYQEILPIFENYQADTKPADVSPEVRALADMCLLLFNTNEFMFIQ